jgi:hypothetical protein
MSLWALFKSDEIVADCADRLYHELFHLTEGLSPTGDPYGTCALFGFVL